MVSKGVVSAVWARDADGCLLTFLFKIQQPTSQDKAYYAAARRHDASDQAAGTRRRGLRCGYILHQQISPSEFTISLLLG